MDVCDWHWEPGIQGQVETYNLHLIEISSLVLANRANTLGETLLTLLQAIKGFNNTWTVTFQMFKLVLEKAEEPEIKLPTSAGSSKKQESSKKNIYFCFIDYAKAFDCVDHNKLWKILKEMGIPDHLTCPLRNLYAGQEPTVRTGHGTTDWFQIGKGVRQGCILSPCLFNLYAEYIKRNAGLEEATSWNQDFQEKYQ